MNNIIRLFFVILVSLLAGCAHLEFGDENAEGLTHFVPKAYLFVTTTKKCVSTATVITVPAKKRRVNLVPGLLGSSDLTVNLEKGMITSVNQKVDTKIPETINAIANLMPSIMPKKAAPFDPKFACTATASLYPIEGGVPNLDKKIPFPVK